MLRYAAALAAMLALSLALADSLDPSRDANLALIDRACLVVNLDATSATTYGSAASSEQVTDMLTKIEATKRVLTQELADQASQSGIPVTADCTGNEFSTLPQVHLYLLVVGTALSYNLRVLLTAGLSGFAYPVVWDTAGLLSRSTGIIPQDVEDQATKAFDAFALAWKKEHPQ